jgi:hypothetical protein
MRDESSDFHLISRQDDSGCLFWKNGRLYQGLHSSSATLYADLLQRGLIKELVQSGLLIENRLMHHTLSPQGYTRIVEYPVPSIVSFAHEWSPEMLRDAGRLVLDLAARLHARNLELRNAHTGNVIFQGPQPVFVNLGAMQPTSSSLHWPEAERFREQFLNPLYLASASAGDVARSLMQTAFDGRISAINVKHFSFKEKLTIRARTVARELARHVLPLHVQRFLRKELPRHRSGGTQGTHLAYLRKELESIPLPQPKTGWSDYYGDCLSPLEPNPAWTSKQRQVFEILARIGPSTVLDVGANRGWYSLMAAKHGASVVAIDTDSTCMSRLYSDARSQSLCVLPLIMDIRAPSPAHGLCGELYSPAWDRLQCDFVLALAIVHHLALRSRLTFDQIVRLLKRFSKRHLLVEFTNPDDPMSKRLIGPWSSSYSWYTSENFQTVLRQHFSAIDRYPSHSETRELYYCAF